MTRRALVTSTALIASMGLYVLGLRIVRDEQGRRQAWASCRFYALHCADSTCQGTDFIGLSPALVLADSAWNRTRGAYRFEYYDPAPAKERRLLARLECRMRGTRVLARCSVFCRPVPKPGCKSEVLRTDSIWRKAYYLAYQADSSWRRIPACSLPISRAIVHQQINTEHPLP